MASRVLGTKPFSMAEPAQVVINIITELGLIPSKCEPCVVISAVDVKSLNDLVETYDI
jgi:hypothetical protein